MKVFSVFGITNSGKTTTVENIIKELRRRGYTVGSVKEIHYDEFQIDSLGTDTNRHRAAGSELVTARGKYETDILYSGKLPIDDILKFYTQDYVVLEGVRDTDIPKIICAHSLEEVEERMDHTVFAISGVISNGIKEFRTGTITSNEVKELTTGVTTSNEVKELRTGATISGVISSGIKELKTGSSTSNEIKQFRTGPSTLREVEGINANKINKLRTVSLPVVSGVEEIQKLVDLIEEVVGEYNTNIKGKQ